MHVKTPVQDKGKTIDPSNWGNVGIDPSGPDPAAQQHEFEAYSRRTSSSHLSDQLPSASVRITTIVEYRTEAALKVVEAGRQARSNIAEGP
ncbi:hypothetical protein WOLCODRAFT_152656 [Wolfiporia cocos MD-104 SS10]|uniref:Uncharacterized protein n=1 Tax=Wolfiporia cocos (strain MD-104) TaxID=742152 RepID=A0A2H3K2K6_WOLCO|nr:hypothetical protein WOLCODRAFT_152656 [Wolfiporia cocos MD-104 SS10]